MKKILVLSDTHIGSTVALWPPELVSVSGHDLRASKFQLWLWACWQSMQKWVKKQVKKGDELTIVFNGDIIEGIHHRTIEIMSPAIDDQYAAAMEIFRDLINELKPKQTFMIKGTECHTGNAEATVGRLIDSVPDPGTKQHAWDYLKLDVDGCVTSFAHHCSCSTRKNLQATQHSIMIFDEAARALDAGRAPARVVCRAHRHEHGVWNTGSHLSCVTGPWQALTRHGQKVVPGAIPKPSAILLNYEGDVLPEVKYKIFQPKKDENMVKI
jgi:hypothetical protein